MSSEQARRTKPEPHPHRRLPAAQGTVRRLSARPTSRRSAARQAWCPGDAEGVKQDFIYTKEEKNK